MSEPKTKTTAAEKQPLTAIEKKFARVFPGEKMHKIKLPRYLGGDKKSIYVGVNGHTFQVPTGQTLEVPTPIFDLLEKMQVQMEVLEGIRDNIPNEI